MAPRPMRSSSPGTSATTCSEAAYRRFRDTLRRRRACRSTCLPGNHDDPATMARLLAGGRFQSRRSRPPRRLGTRAARQPRARRTAWPGLRRRLRPRLHAATCTCCATSRCCSAVHHPPVPVGSPWIDALGLRNAAELLARLERFPNVRVVVSGHVHQAFDTRRGALRLLTTLSTCAQFTPRTLALRDGHATARLPLAVPARGRHARDAGRLAARGRRQAA